MRLRAVKITETKRKMLLKFGERSVWIDRDAVQVLQERVDRDSGTVVEVMVPDALAMDMDLEMFEV